MITLITPDKFSNYGIRTLFWCRIHLWFRLTGGLQTKSMTSQRNRATHKMADMRYYGSVMTTTRWRICVTMATLWQQQDGGYMLLWKRYGNNKMAAILHLRQYSRRLNFFFLCTCTAVCHSLMDTVALKGHQVPMPLACGIWRRVKGKAIPLQA